MTPNLGQGGCTALEVSSPTRTAHTSSFGHACQVSDCAVLSGALSHEVSIGTSINLQSSCMQAKLLLL